MSHRRAIADMVERSIRTREENMDLRARIRELEERLQNRNRKLEQEVEYLQTDVDLRDDDIRNYLEDIKHLEQRLFNRDAAWERAIQSLAEQGVIMVDDPVAAIRERLESERGES